MYIFFVVIIRWIAKLKVIKRLDEKDRNRVAGGYKATIHNPDMNEAKVRAQENLAKMGVDETSRPKERSWSFSFHHVR